MLPGGLVRALDWLRGHLHGAVQLDVLAQVAGVRPRTLETHFKLYLGTTPLGYARRMRLAHARQQLLNAPSSASVTEVALASGFSQLGRFAAQYRQHFGEPPSQTLRRLRRSLPSEADDLCDEALRLSWRALPAAFMVTPKQCTAALEDLDRAQELAPAFGLSKALAAWCWGQRAAHHFSVTPHEDQNRARRLADEACRLAPQDALTLSLCSAALTLAHRLDEAERVIERVLAFDPWSPWGWMRRGLLSAYQGDDDSALRELFLTLHLMPFEPLRHLTFVGIGCAQFGAGRYERAARWAQAAVESYPESLSAKRVLAAAAARAGARVEARRIARQLLRKDPNLTVSVARTAWPFTPDFMTRLCDGLETAGLPRA